MKDLQSKSLFDELSAQESATVNGGHYYYYRPCRYHYRPSYRRSGGSSYGYGSSSAVNQTVNVNVLVND